MYSKTKIAFKYINYYLAAFNGKGHGTHSPFIFQFIREVLNDRQSFPEYNKVEALRKELLADHILLNIDDYGAGSSSSKTNKRTIASIARNAAKPAKFGQLLFRMSRAYQPQTILELGTSLGITTSYLSLANPSANVITMEGATAIAEVAKANFRKLDLKNIELVEGDFDIVLKTTIDRLPSVDLAFIDGNHRREPTERYFQQLLPLVHNDSILVFDDIHWSREMEDAWQTIKLHPSVTCSVDLFFIGIIFLRKEFLEKQHFTIRF